MLRNNQGGYEKHFNDFIENNLQVLNSKKVYMLISKIHFPEGGPVGVKWGKENERMRWWEVPSPKNKHLIVSYH